MGQFFTVTSLAIFCLGSEQRPQPISAETEVPQCQPVNTQWDGALVLGCAESPGQVCAAGRIRSGPLRGLTETVYYGSADSAGMPNVEPATTISYSGIQVIHTEQGDLHASAVGIADMARHVFTEISRITGGTGRFTGATGNLFVSGTLAPDGIGFQSKVSGEICLQRTE
jgi:hypothetical protein